MSVKISNALSIKLRVLSFLAAVCVAFLHFSNFVETNGRGMKCWQEIFALGVTHCAVPFFFMVSGFSW